jgi:hypothetical protein
MQGAGLTSRAIFSFSRNVLHWVSAVRFLGTALHQVISCTQSLIMTQVWIRNLCETSFYVVVLLMFVKVVVTCYTVPAELI